LLSEWEAQYIEGVGDARGPSYHSLYAWLAQVVSLALYRRQGIAPERVSRCLPTSQAWCPWSGTNAPLWVFSVNHDVLVECLAPTSAFP